MKKEKSNYAIQSVAYALDVLESFRDREEFSLSDLTRRLKFSRSRMIGLLATLEAHNFLEQDKVRGNYRLGLHNLQLGQAFARQAGLLRQGRAVLQSLAKECGETSSVAVLSDFQTVFLYTVESELPVRVVPRIDPALPFYCTAAGKVLAAGVDERNLQAYIKRVLAGYPAGSFRDPDALTKHLSRIAELGYARSEEQKSCVTDVAAPVLDFTQHVVGAVTVSVPSMRLPPGRISDELVPLVTGAARQISLKLGYHALC